LQASIVKKILESIIILQWYTMNNKTENKKSSLQVLQVKRSSALLEFLYESFPDQSRKSVKSILENKRVSIGNKTITQFDYQLEPGMEIIIGKKNVAADIPLRKMKMVYEDEYIIVIDKDCGLLSVSTGKEHEETAFSILRDYVKSKKRDSQLFVLHRLDRETSGIMMFAKNIDVQQKMQDNWDEAVTKRIYYALVEGRVAEVKGEIVSWLKESKSLKVFSSHKPGDGQKAVTQYRVLKTNDRYSILQVSLETGRKNQIRIHMHDIGHPVAGDKKYGAVTDPIRRMGLHAGVLEFIHPVTGECMHFETPVPALFTRLFG